MLVNTIKNELFAEVAEAIEDMCGASTYEMREEVVDKGFKKAEALVVRKAGSDIGVTLYEELIKKRLEDECMEDLVHYIEKAISAAPQINGSNLLTFCKEECVKEELVYEGAVPLGSVFVKIPETDLAVTFRFMFSHESGEDEDKMSIRISESLLDSLGWTKEQLIAAARKNEGNLSCKSLREQMIEMGVPEFMISENDANAPTMYVCTNDAKMYGASVLWNDAFLAKIHEKVGGDYYILPSSKHEVLAVPVCDKIDSEELLKMVHEVNETEVSPADKLSDSLYGYMGGRLIQVA